MKRIFLITSILLVGSSNYAYAQVEPSPTPETPICISRAAAESCATNAAKAKAQESQIAALEQAGRDKDAIINDLKVELARMNGLLTGKQQANVQLNTMVQFLLTNGRKKCGPLNLICIQ